MRIVNKKGIQSLLRNPEEEEPLGRVGRIMYFHCLKETGWEDGIVLLGS